MIIRGIYYDDQVRSFRMKRAFLHLVEVGMGSLTKKDLTSRPSLHFTAKERKHAESIPVVWPTSFAWENKKQEKADQKSPYWSVQIKDAVTSKIDLEYLFRSNMPITTTAVAGGSWEVAIGGYLFNRFLKQKLTRSALHAASKVNPLVAAGSLYAGVGAIVLHDTGVMIDTMPERGLGYRLQMMMDGFNMPSGSSLGSAIT